MLIDVLCHAKILIVDDELPNVRLLELILERAGYDNVSMTTDSRHVLAMFEDDQPDLILLDLHMPHLTGYEVMESLTALLPPETYLPIIVLTADATPDAKRRALTSGATDFVCKPFDNLEVIQRIRNALYSRYLHLQLRNQNQILEERVKERTEQLEAALAELRRAQEEAMQQERVRALGKMAAGIAHDFNNILSLILGYGEMLLHESEIAEGDPRARKYVRNIIGASEDGVEMIKRMSQFQRPPSGGDVRQSLHLAEVVRQAVELTRPRWKEQAMAKNIDIAVETDFAYDSDIVGDPGEIRELLINSIFNAVDAMPTGGTITFRTRAQGDSVILEIEDNGVGMTEEIRSRCMEPFYTTKGERGSGLGLAMIYGIAQRHRGSVHIETAPGAGTKIQICLPNEQRAAAEAAAPVALACEPLRVLVVDDQPLLCEILTEYLGKDGHYAEAASNGEEALEKFKAGKFDLVITDRAMPGMSGNQLAAEIRKSSDAAMVILLTGFAESGISSSMTPEIDAVVGKPVALATLRQAIVQSLTARSARQPALPHLPTAGFLRTRPEGALSLDTIKAHLADLTQQPAYALKKRNQS